MKIIKFIKISSLFLFLFISMFKGQEINADKKIKIGKFEYKIYLKEDWNYEDNKTIIRYIINRNGKEQVLGFFLTYRKPNSSEEFKNKIDENHPPDERSLFKDGIINLQGNMKIDYSSNIIEFAEFNFHKDYDSEPDCTIRKFRQNKQGFFDLILIKEISKDSEKIVFQK